MENAGRRYRRWRRVAEGSRPAARWSDQRDPGPAAPARSAGKSISARVSEVGHDHAWKKVRVPWVGLVANHREPFLTMRSLRIGATCGRSGGPSSCSLGVREGMGLDSHPSPPSCLPEREQSTAWILTVAPVYLSHHLAH